MSIINDYATQLLVADRQHELQNEAAEAHLARVAQGDRPTWIRSLLHGLKSILTHRPDRRSAVASRPRVSH